MDNTKLVIDIFDSFAGEYEKKFMDFKLYNDSFNLFCEAVKKRKPSVFEIACGPGNVTKYLLTKRPDFEITAIDLSPRMLELAKANNPRTKFKMMDCRDIDQIDEKFDAVMCGFCLPYLSKNETIKLIENVSNLLNKNGVLYISTMEGHYSKSGFQKPSNITKGKELFVHFHQVGYLTEALLKNDFTITHMSRMDFPEEKEMPEKDLLIIAKK